MTTLAAPAHLADRCSSPSRPMAPLRPEAILHGTHLRATASAGGGFGGYAWIAPSLIATLSGGGPVRCIPGRTRDALILASWVTAAGDGFIRATPDLLHALQAALLPGTLVAGADR